MAAILISFTSGRGHALVDLARQAGLPTSTAHRLARELTDRHLLERTEDGEFRVGLPLRMLSGDAAEPPTLHERAPFVVDDLCEATRATARLGVLDDLEVAYIERQPGHRRSAPSPPPLGCPCTPPRSEGAAGVRAVTGGADGAHPVAAGLHPGHPDDVDQIHRALQCARLHGVATSCGELQSGRCEVAVPVLGPTGTAIAAVGVEMPDLEHATLGRVVPALVLAARGLAGAGGRSARARRRGCAGPPGYLSAHFG